MVNLFSLGGSVEGEGVKDGGVFLLTGTELVAGGEFGAIAIGGGRIPGRVLGWTKIGIVGVG